MKVGGVFISKLRKVVWSLVLIFLISQGTVAFAALHSDLEKHDPDKYAIIYGAIDCSTTNFDLLRVNLYRYPFKITLKNNNSAAMDVNEGKGYFFTIVKPGQYFIVDFRLSGRQLTIVPMPYESKADVESRLMSVKEGDVFYWGSTKFYKTRESSFNQSSRYGIAPTDEPGERKLLEEILKSSKGTKWESVIITKLEAINKWETKDNNLE